MADTSKDKLTFDLLLVTDKKASASRDRKITETVDLALDHPEAHRVAVLLRDKSASLDEIEAEARALQEICDRQGATLLIHTHVDLCLALNLAGAHLSATGDLSAARARLGPDKILGCSRHRDDVLDEAQIGPADFVTLSPVFVPTSKPDDDRAPVGEVGLSKACARSVRPVFALGGVNIATVPSLKDSGARGAAVLGSVMGAEDPRTEVRALLAELSAGD